MEINKDEAKNIVNQLQQAHRISVAFYRRMLPLFDETARKLGLGFYHWETLETNLPPKRATRPSSKWAWDFVPLYASKHAYRRSKNEKSVVKGDVGICFFLYIEDSFASENRKESGQPDPVDMPVGKATIRAYAYRPKAEYKRTFESWWSEDDSLEIDDGQKWHSVNEVSEGVAFEWQLADVIANNQLMVQTLSKYIETQGES